MPSSATKERHPHSLPAFSLCVPLSLRVLSLSLFSLCLCLSLCLYLRLFLCVSVQLLGSVMHRRWLRLCASQCLGVNSARISCCFFFSYFSFLGLMIAGDAALLSVDTVCEYAFGKHETAHVVFVSLVDPWIASYCKSKSSVHRHRLFLLLPGRKKPETWSCVEPRRRRRRRHKQWSFFLYCISAVASSRMHHLQFFFFVSREADELHKSPVRPYKSCNFRDHLLQNFRNRYICDEHNTL